LRIRLEATVSCSAKGCNNFNMFYGKDYCLFETPEFIAMASKHFESLGWDLHDTVNLCKEHAPKPRAKKGG